MTQVPRHYPCYSFDEHGYRRDSRYHRLLSATDSERFYDSIFEDPEEQEEVKNLLTWWNRCVLILLVSRLIYIFPTSNRQE